MSPRAPALAAGRDDFVSEPVRDERVREALARGTAADGGGADALPAAA